MSSKAPKATENLAKEICMNELQMAGATREEAEKAWDEDEPGRQLYRDFARIHADFILAEAGAADV